MKSLKAEFEWQSLVEAWGGAGPEWEWVNTEATRNSAALLKSAYLSCAQAHYANLDMAACLVHGDFHPGNIFFDKETNEAVLIDWQMWGSGHPLVEVVYYMFLGLHNSTKSYSTEQILRLLSIYHTQFLASFESKHKIKSAYTWAMLRRDFATVALDFCMYKCADCGKVSTPKQHEEMAAKSPHNKTLKSTLVAWRVWIREWVHLSFDIANNLEDWFGPTKK